MWKSAEHVICNGGPWEDGGAWSKCSVPGNVPCVTPLLGPRCVFIYTSTT